MKSCLWIVDVNFAERHYHGGILRFVNLSKELVAQGVSVTLAVCYEGDLERGREWVESLRTEGVCTNHCELSLPPPSRRWNKLATLLLPLGLHRWAIRSFVRESARAIDAALKRFPAEIVFVSSRSLLFAAPYSKPQGPCIGDFSDSMALYMSREIRTSLRTRQFRSLPGALLRLYHYSLQELYSCRKYGANWVVSPVDKRVFDFFGDPRKNVCIGNGVREGGCRVKKIPNQIVFSGTMSFSPNHEAAMWFLDHVFPRVLRKWPHLKLVIAGANPLESLRHRAGPNVEIPGYVPDMQLTIAESALYVAPLISGSGFKNKVIEAIASGTYVIGTTLAAEFLDPSMRELITVRDDPQEMADAICEFFAGPDETESKVQRLRQMVRERFSWPAKAQELIRFADEVISGSEGGYAGRS